MSRSARANPVDLTDTQALVREVERLRREVSRLEALVVELDKLACSDTLVDLPNRRAFVARLRNLIARAERYGDTGAVLFLDVDGLKLINDTWGHRAGDAALIEIARILVATARDSDCIARIGGDEFAVLVERTDELNAWRTGLRLVEEVVGARLAIDGHRVRLSVAVGVACVEAGAEPEEIIERADRSMYRIKSM